MVWLRFLLFTVLLARIAAGSAWAMPTTVDAALGTDHPVSAANMPCHMAVSATDEGIATSHSVTSHSANSHAHAGHTADSHCALCFPAPTMAVSLPVTTAGFCVPTTAAKTSSHWQRAPDLRPPI